MNLSDRRRSGNGIERDPFTFAELDNVLGRRINQCISLAQGIGTGVQTWSMDTMCALTFLFFVNSRIREK